MAQILDVNSLIYLENGKDGSGWYIIPAGHDIEDLQSNGELVEIAGDRFVYQNGLPVSGSVDIVLIYTSDSFANRDVIDEVLIAVDNTQSSNNPVKILLTNEYQYTDYEFSTDLQHEDGEIVQRIFVINPDVAITNIDHSEDSATNPLISTTDFNISITLQNSDGTTGTWVINQAETSISFAGNPAQVSQNSQFQLGADGDILTARAFITAYEVAAPFFEADSYSFSIDENVDDFDFTQAVTAKSSLNLALVTDYQLEGAPAGFSISDAGIISYDGNGFDYETAPENGYAFSVIATAPNGKTATSTVTVFVNDVEEPLAISVETTGGGASIAENIADGSGANVENVTILLTDPEQDYSVDAQDVTVFDLDENGLSSTFEAILSGDSIDGSASITLHKLDGVTIDHETKSSYNLEIRALDEEGNIVSEQVNAPLAGEPADLNALLTALGLTLSDGTDRTGNGSNDTVIIQRRCRFNDIRRGWCR